MESEKRKSYQIRALLRKSFVLQWRRIGTNICQILTPILCLLLVLLIKKIAESQIGKDSIAPTMLVTFPRYLNPPLLPNFALYDLIGASVTSCEEYYYYDIEGSDQATIDFVGHLDGDDSDLNSGLLGTIPNYFCKMNAKNNPFFIKPDTTINQDIYNHLEVINSNPMHHHKTVYTEFLVDGAVTFYNASSSFVKYKAQINDNVMGSYHRRNGVTKLGISDGENTSDIDTVTEGLLSLMDMVNQGLMKMNFPNTFVYGMVQYMPLSIDTLVELNRVLNLLGANLYPLAITLLLPVFMYSIVLEKEEKLQDFMRMNGMRILNYWLVNFLFNYLVYVLTIGTFFLFGFAVLRLQFFTETSAAVLIAFLAGWGIAQISLAFFIQVFISKARTATIWGYLLSIWTVLWGITLNVAVYPMPEVMSWYMILFPHFAMTRAIYLMSQACAYYECVGSFAEVGEELSWCIGSLWLTGVVILILSIYLNEIVPREFGVPKSPLFFLKKKNTREEFVDTYMDFEEEDEAVKQERQSVYKMSSGDHPLVAKNLTKIYKGNGKKPDKVAVNRLCLHIKEGEMFGLLGPNGAGKTTLISMLTGLHKPNAGNAWISGYDIASELDKVQLHMGVCPQFDILWPQLTVEEHLLFYCRLKGVSPDKENEKVESAMEEVYLTPHRNVYSCELSGGMRRRLSVAISLVGDPRIVFLDEPTTGLDPENRRQLWDILAVCKKERAIVLTTHSMEEADVLCTRIAIVNFGVLRCIGPQASLKSYYGGGYHLFINVKRKTIWDEETLLRQVKDYVMSILPSAHLLSEFNGNLIYQVPLGTCKVSSVFRNFEKHKEEIGIADWGISQSSLEDVFLKVVGA